MAFDVQDKGGGVFLFKREYRGFVFPDGPAGPFACGAYTDNNFPEELARFRENHPDLNIANITPDEDEDGTTKGYLVVCNKRNTRDVVTA